MTGNASIDVMFIVACGLLIYAAFSKLRKHEQTT